MPADRDRGSLTLTLAALFAVLLAFAGLALDGSAKLAQDESATAVAQEAARAGAGEVNRSVAYSSGRFTVAGPQAVAAARAYLIAAGYRRFTVVQSGPDTITVTVTVTSPTRMLSLIGIDSMTSTGSAKATLVSGVAGPGR